MSPIVSSVVFGLVLFLSSVFGVYCHSHFHEVEAASRPEDVQGDGTESVTGSMVEQMQTGPTARTTVRTCGPYTNCGFQLYEQPDPFHFRHTQYIESICGKCRKGYACKWFEVAMKNEMIVYNCQPVEEGTTVTEPTTQPPTTTATETGATDDAYPPGSLHRYTEEERKEIATGMVHVVLLRQSENLRPSNCQAYMPCGAERIDNGTAEYFPYCPSCPEGYECTPFETEVNGWFKVYTCDPVRNTTTTEEELVAASFPYQPVHDRRVGSMDDIHEL